METLRTGFNRAAIKRCLLSGGPLDTFNVSSADVQWRILLSQKPNGYDPPDSTTWISFLWTGMSVNTT